MTQIAEKLYREALGLSPNERVGLVEELLNSLDKTDATIDSQWASEAESRLRGYRAGEIESYPSDEVFAELNRA